MNKRTIIIGGIALSLAAAGIASANHSWGNYHWARAANPFTLQLGDNVSGAWDAYLGGASADWSQSSVLDTAIVAGGTRPKNCQPTAGRIEVCNAAYGKTGWLGIARIWVNSASHITQATARVNDTYFKAAFYNTPAWRRFVMCQEIAHGFGLDHQDENFTNANLGSCMDYTSDPDGPPSNEHPNQHDFDQLKTIYGHFDATKTVKNLIASAAALARDGDGERIHPAEWGKEIRRDARGNGSVWRRDLGNGEKIFTFVIWADTSVAGESD